MGQYHYIVNLDKKEYIKLVKIGAKIVHHGRYVTFQMVEVAVPGGVFGDIPSRVDRLRPAPAPA